MAREAENHQNNGIYNQPAIPRREFLKRNSTLLVGGPITYSLLNGCDSVGLQQPRGTPVRSSNFKSINFIAPTTTAIDVQGSPCLAQFEGSLDVSEQGVVNGSLTVSWPSAPGVTTRINVVNDSLTFDSENPLLGEEFSSSTLGLLSGSPADAVSVGGESTGIAGILDSAAGEWEANPTDCASWSANTLHLAALAAMSKIPAVAVNVNEAQNQELLQSGLWCKLACDGAAATVAAVGGLSCAAVIAACGVSEVFTIGGVTLPCALLIAACFGVDFLAAAVVHDICLEAWGA